MGYRLISHIRRQVVGYLALFIALGGTGYAAFKLPKDSVGTRQIRKNAVTSSKLATGIQRQLNRKGRQGPPATKLWALVSVNGSDATLVRGSGVTGVSRTDTGFSNVSFNQPIAGCSYEASEWSNAGGVPLTPVAITPITGGTTQAATDVRVAIQRTDNGTLVDNYSYSLAVFC